MKCKNCKAELPDELHFTFCGYCGERLARERKKKDEIKIPTPRKRGQRWYVDLRREGVTVIEDTEAEAKAKAIAIRAGLIETKKKRPEITLRQAIDNYINDRDNALSPSTIRGYIAIKNNAFAPIMDTDIFSVRNWQAAVNTEAGRGISAKTLSNEWILIKTVLSKNNVDTSAVSAMPQIVRRDDMPWLDYEQIKIFLKAAQGTECELAALFALHSLRRSELLNLTPRHIENGVIHVSGGVVFDKDHNLVSKKENKNAASKRDVAIMIPRLVELLSAYIGAEDEPYIKCAPDTLRIYINRVCSSAGLPLVGVHGLRRSFASLAYHLGWSERQTMATGGWSNIGTVHRIYIKLSERDKNVDIEKMKAFYSQ